MAGVQHSLKPGRKKGVREKRLTALSDAERDVKATGIRFLPECSLGSGGLCEVVAARDLLRHEYGDGTPRVAIKRLLPEYARNPAARRLMAREFFIARNLSHPGIVRVFDLHEDHAGPFLSMELLAGKNLYIMQAEQPSGLGAAVIPLAYSLFETLSFLHAAGVAHGDIKPANLIQESNNRLVLLDFNTAEIIPLPGCASSPLCQGLRSNLGQAACSILHASPERLEGRAPSFADDIFAACCTLYELAQGSHPFGRHTSREAQSEGKKPAGMSWRKARKEKILLQGLSYDPMKRPTAAELAEAFRPGKFEPWWLSWLQVGRNTIKEF